MFTIVTRRDFLATSAGTIASLAVAHGLEAAHAEPCPAPTGVIYGRAGRKGIPPGTAAVPSRGQVVLLDGRVLEGLHDTSQGIRAGAGVLLCPDQRGGWSILYAEFSD